MTPDQVLLTARIVTGLAFLIIGWRNIDNQPAIAGVIKANGFPVPQVLSWVGVAMQMGFGALMMTTWQPLIAAGGLLLFTVAATLMAHSFWMVDDPVQRKLDYTVFLSNMIMAGGLLALLAAAL